MSNFLDRTTDPVTDAVISAAIEVHRSLGPGLLESAYAACLSCELRRRNVAFDREVSLNIEYGSERIVVAAYRIDFLVEGSVVVEVKALERLIPLHRAQLLTYLRLGRYSRGLLLNFGAARMADGISRVVNGWKPTDSQARSSA